MGKMLKSVLVSVALGVSPLSSASTVKSSSFVSGHRTELSEALQSNEVKESFEVVDADVVVNAVMKYFDEDVKKFKLSAKARNEVKSILTSYFSSHSFFVVNNFWRVEFYIDDKKEFSKMIKNVVNVVIEDMPFLVKKVVIPLFLWWNGAIQRKLDNLDGTVYNMKEKQYREIIFDCVAWITKKICVNINWKTMMGEFFKSISKYFPNKSWSHVLQELNVSGQSNQDIKNFKYKK